jgi:hypothetical protein
MHAIDDIFHTFRPVLVLCGVGVGFIEIHCKGGFRHPPLKRRVRDDHILAGEGILVKDLGYWKALSLEPMDLMRERGKGRDTASWTWVFQATSSFDVVGTMGRSKNDLCSKRGLIWIGLYGI